MINIREITPAEAPVLSAMADNVNWNDLFLNLLVCCWFKLFAGLLQQECVVGVFAYRRLK